MKSERLPIWLKVPSPSGARLRSDAYFDGTNYIAMQESPMKGNADFGKAVRAARLFIVQDSFIDVAADNRLQKHSRKIIDRFLHLSRSALQRRINCWTHADD